MDDHKLNFRTVREVAMQLQMIKIYVQNNRIGSETEKCAEVAFRRETFVQSVT
jgi:hypothetical protein